MPYYIRHMVKTRTGIRLLDFKQVLCDRCKKCRREVPQIFFGLDRKSICAVEAVYKYKATDIIEEYTNMRKGSMPKICKEKGCDKNVY